MGRPRLSPGVVPAEMKDSRCVRSRHVVERLYLRDVGGLLLGRDAPLASGFHDEICVVGGTCYRGRTL